MVPSRLFPPRNIPSMKSMHGNNVVWLCAKYAVDANLFRLESSILTRAKRATNRNNIGVRDHSLVEYTGVERSGGNFPGGSTPRTVTLILMNYACTMCYTLLIHIYCINAYCMYIIDNICKKKHPTFVLEIF